MGKKYDVAAVTGTYTDRDGNEKRRYQNVGAIIEGRDGNEFLILERWFNPAGLPDPEGRGSVILSLFEPRQQQNRGGYDQRPQGGGYGQQRQGMPDQGLDDSIPF
jgi:hypothetical protein